MTRSPAQPSDSPGVGPKGPGHRRGRYDRRASPSERARAQHAHLLTAVRLASLDGGEITVARLLEYVGCGRNTFYEHFDDAAGAIAAACHESGQNFEAVISAALFAPGPRTPGDAMWDLANAWAEWCMAERQSHWSLLERFASTRIESQLHAAASTLHRQLVLAGAAASALSTSRADAAAGALRSVARGVHQRRQQRDEDAMLTIAESSYDALTRLLR